MNERKDTTKPKSPQEGLCDMSCNEYSAYVSILSNLIKGVSCFMSIELSKNHSSFQCKKKSCSYLNNIILMLKFSCHLIVWLNQTQHLGKIVFSGFTWLSGWQIQIRIYGFLNQCILSMFMLEVPQPFLQHPVVCYFQ